MRTLNWTFSLCPKMHPRIAEVNVEQFSLFMYLLMRFVHGLTNAKWIRTSTEAALHHVQSYMCHLLHKIENGFADQIFSTRLN